jgi:predicted RNA methylase
MELTGKLDRKLYVAVNEVLEAAGGKWNRKAHTHVFEFDARAKIAAMLANGKVKDEAKDADFFETPPELAKELVRLAGAHRGDVVLEPSAGRGAIVEELLAVGAFVRACELLEENRAVLHKRFDGNPRFELDRSNFDASDWRTPQFTHVVMNPPFQFEIEHVTLAHSLLLPGGRLVSIMSTGVLTNAYKKTQGFRRLVADCGGRFVQNADGAFKSSGTMVRTLTLVLPARK